MDFGEIFFPLSKRQNLFNYETVIPELGYVFNGKGIKNSIARILYRMALHFSEYVLVLNEENKRILVRQKMVKLSKIISLEGGEGINLQRYVPLFSDISNKHNVVFLMVARLLYDKGYVEYVKAACSVREKYPEAEFLLVGDVDALHPNHVCEKQLKEDCDLGYIRYLGYSSDVASLIQQADCVVLPSYHEGLSRVLMEVLAIGKPIITTDIPGCRETVENGENGFLVPLRDSHALAMACEKFIKIDRAKRIKMGKYSRTKAEEKFDVKKIIDMYQQITLVHLS